VNHFKPLHQDGERAILAELQIADVFPLVVGVAFNHERLHLVSVRPADHRRAVGHGNFSYFDVAALQKHKFLLRYRNLVYYRLVVIKVKGTMLCILSGSEIAH